MQYYDDTGQDQVSNTRIDDLAVAASGGGDDCCPHVVDPLLFVGALAGVAIATYFIRQAITMNIMRRKRRKRQASANQFCYLDDCQTAACAINAGNQLLLVYFCLRVINWLMCHLQQLLKKGKWRVPLRISFDPNVGQLLSGFRKVYMDLSVKRKASYDLLGAPSGYGHSSYGGYSSGHSNHGSYSSGYEECCPLVVDPLTFAALLSFLAAATYLLQTVIAMTIMMARRRRSYNEKDTNLFQIIDEGNLFLCIFFALVAIFTKFARIVMIIVTLRK